MPDVDIAIIGGGCSGLSLAHRLAGHGVSLAVIEPRPEYVNDRAWSFWRVAPHPYEEAVAGQWASWTVKAAGGITHRHAQGAPYQSLDAGRFYEITTDAIHAADGVDLHLGTQAGQVTELANAIKVETSAGDMTARHVVDTRPGMRQPRYGQFFLGREIEVETPLFDASTVQLMHFRRGYSDGVDFLYVLPFSPTRALVEVTSFASTPPTPQVFANWLDDELEALGASIHDIIREERGALPMEVGFGSATEGPAVRMGLGGGAARPSTGYAFQRIQTQADQLAHQILNDEPLRTPRDGWVMSAMDAIFLRVIQSAPERGPAIFEALFRNSPPGRLERFLSGSINPIDRLSIMTSLPPLPFLAAAARLR